MKYNFDFPVYNENADESQNITALYIRCSELASEKESNDIKVQ